MLFGRSLSHMTCTVHHGTDGIKTSAAGARFSEPLPYSLVRALSLQKIAANDSFRNQLSDLFFGDRLDMPNVVCILANTSVGSEVTRACYIEQSLALPCTGIEIVAVHPLGYVHIRLKIRKAHIRIGNAVTEHKVVDKLGEAITRKAGTQRINRACQSRILSIVLT